MNSCLHHFVEIDKILNLIKSSMKKGNYFIKLNLFLDKILNTSKKGSVFSVVLKKLY